MENEYLKPDQVAELTGLSIRDVRTKVREGVFKAKRTSPCKQGRLRILRSSVLEWFEKLPDALAATRT